MNCPSCSQPLAAEGAECAHCSSLNLDSERSNRETTGPWNSHLPDDDPEFFKLEKGALLRPKNNWATPDEKQDSTDPKKKNHSWSGQKQSNLSWGEPDLNETDPWAQEEDQLEARVPSAPISPESEIPKQAPARAQAISSAPPNPSTKPLTSHSDTKKKAIAAVASVILCGFLFTKFTNSSPPEKQTDATTQQLAELKEEPSEQSAVIWLESAEESLTNKDFELALEQLKKAKSIVSQNEGDKSEMTKIDLKIAETLTLKGDLKAAHLAWSKLDSETSQHELSSLNKKLRIKAGKLLKKSSQEQQDGNELEAVRLARQALSLYEDHQGKKPQITKAHEHLGELYQEQGQRRLALVSLQEAQSILPSQEREEIIASFTAKNAVKKRPLVKKKRKNQVAKSRVVRKKKRLSFGNGNKVPQAKRSTTASKKVDNEELDPREVFAAKAREDNRRWAEEQKRKQNRESDYSQSDEDSSTSSEQSAPPGYR